MGNNEDQPLLNSDQRSMILHQLLREYENILYQYKIKVRTPSLKLNDSKQTMGSWDRTLHQISISSHLIRSATWKQVVEVLKHEIAHQISDELLGGHSGHDDTFSRACEMIFVEHWARSATVEINFHQPTLETLVSNSSENGMERRLKKLLSLAESSNEHEASLALKKATEIKKKYDLVINRKYTSSDIHCHILRTKKKRLDSAYTYLAKILTTHFGVKAIFSSEFDITKESELKTIELIGAPKDLLVADYVYHYLLNTLDSLWNHHKKNEHKKGSKALARGSYRLGVLVGFLDTLNNSAKSNDSKANRVSAWFRRKPENENEKETQDLNKPILIHNTLVLDDYFNSKYPRVSSTKSRTSGGDSQSYSAGKNAGRKIRISDAVSGSQPKGPKLLR